MILSDKQHWGTIIVGGSQSGLATGYYLKNIREDFIILETSDHIGQTWEKRWDSLKLFSPTSFNKLPGWSYPSAKGGPDTKEEMADYLNSYATKQDLPVKFSSRVTSLSKSGLYFHLTTATDQFTAERVVVATGAHQFSHIPAFAGKMNRNIFQIHSDEYRNPSLLPPGDVLVVGSAISGMQIALELSKTRNIRISGKPNYVIPKGLSQVSQKLDWWLLQNLVTIKTAMGRKVKPQFIHGGGVFHYLVKELSNSKIPVLERISGVKDGKPALESGEVVETPIVIWCTGHRPDFSWIKEKVTDQAGWPMTHRGISSLEGLYFIGMPFQFGLTSSLIAGLSRDAAFIAKNIEGHRHTNKTNLQLIKTG